MKKKFNIIEVEMYKVKNFCKVGPITKVAFHLSKKISTTLHTCTIYPYKSKGRFQFISYYAF